MSGIRLFQAKDYRMTLDEQRIAVRLANGEGFREATGEKDWNQAVAGLESSADGSAGAASGFADASAVVPSYRHPGKNWRLKRAAVPRWYKARAGVRTHVQSGAARVARFRPRKFR